MISYNKHVLTNGLTLLTHEDRNTPMVTVNLLYNVGARDEDPNRTGFAHLFEHLMFGGSEHVPDYDLHVNNVGGESNAFTNNDYTDYHLTVPARFLETALWLESDRMRSLVLSQQTLSVQQQVVTEEYHQRYANQPYGDVWLLLRPLCYQVHPYRWCTIGQTIEHVQQATLDDVRHFFNTFYRPNNAIMAIAGNISDAEATRLVEKWFADIPAGTPYRRNLPREPLPTAERSLTVHRNVPADALYVAYPMCNRLHPDFYAYDLLSDVLANGNSSRLYNRLVKQAGLFTEINAYITADADEGLFVVSGRLADGVPPSAAQQAIDEQLTLLATTPVPDTELRKVAGKAESTFAYSQYKAIDRALALCYYEWLGHAEWVNSEATAYAKLTAADLQRVAAQCFVPQHRCTLFYLKEQ